MRTSVRPEGRRRETLCGLLAEPVAGQYFLPAAAHACSSCVAIAAANPLAVGISVSNELSRMRAVLDEVVERRLDPAAALAWLSSTVPPARDAGPGPASGLGSDSDSDLG